MWGSFGKWSSLTVVVNSCFSKIGSSHSSQYPFGRFRSSVILYCGLDGSPKWFASRIRVGVAICSLGIE